MKFRAIQSGLFACLVLVSSSSFIIGMHVCSGEIRNISFFGKAEGCEKEKQLPPCHRHEAPSCCENETIAHEGTAFAAGTATIDLSPVSFVALAQPASFLVEVTPAFPVSSEYHYAHDPPMPFGDLTVAFHSLLI